MGLSDDQIRFQLFRAILERSSECLLFVDHHRVIRYWSRAAESLFELTSNDLPTHESVQCCALPTPSELERLKSSSTARISGPVAFESPSGVNIGLTRDVELVDMEGESWLMVRFRRPPQIKPSESELYQQARTDHLSGLLNRRGFQSILEDNLNRRLALAIIDVDFFKNINDSHGHETGDQAIQWLADRFREEFPDAVCIGRLGGDEFGVVLDVLDRELIEKRFQRFCRRIGADQNSLNAGGMTISIGVAVANSPGIPARELLSQADRAMYQSKDRGRNSSTLVDVSNHF